MKKITKKIVIFFLVIILFFVFSPGQIFSQRPLEVEYPEIQGFKPQTIATLIPDYVKYIFNFSIAVIGLIGLGALMVGGIRYLTSAGSPEQRKSAKKQIVFAFLGMLILLFSYLILTTINPQLVIFRPLGVGPVPPTPPIEPPISVAPTPDLLGRIKELAEAVKRKANEMKSTAEEIVSLTNNCNCGTTQPLCLCKDYYGSCSPDNVNPCYSAKPDQPCPDNGKIKANQQAVFAQKDDMLYYKNRALAEREDLKENLEKILYKEIEWYANKIKAETAVQNQLPEGAAKELTRFIIKTLEQNKAKLEKEKGIKERVKEKLLELANAIEELREPGKKISELPNECLTNVPSKCQGSCSGGCHDTLGCFPGQCGGGNPCPTPEIREQSSSISNSASKIIRIADEIIEIISEIR